MSGKKLLNAIRNLKKNKDSQLWQIWSAQLLLTRCNHQDCQWLAVGRWFCSGTRVTLNTITLTLT